jgi:hypothetical protein
MLIQPAPRIFANALEVVKIAKLLARFSAPIHIELIRTEDRQNAFYKKRDRDVSFSRVSYLITIDFTLDAADVAKSRPYGLVSSPVRSVGD